MNSFFNLTKFQKIEFLSRLIESIDEPGDELIDLYIKVVDNKDITEKDLKVIENSNMGIG